VIFCLEAIHEKEASPLGEGKKKSFVMALNFALNKKKNKQQTYLK